MNHRFGFWFWSINRTLKDSLFRQFIQCVRKVYTPIYVQTESTVVQTSFLRKSLDLQGYCLLVRNVITMMEILWVHQPIYSTWERVMRHLYSYQKRSRLSFFREHHFLNPRKRMAYLEWKKLDQSTKPELIYFLFCSEGIPGHS